jgi:hypothetical protein
MFPNHHFKAILLLWSGIFIPFAGNGLCGAKKEIVHHGYSDVDRFLECVGSIYGKKAIRYPSIPELRSIKELRDESCPQTREKLLELLNQKQLRIYDAGDWVYLIESRYFEPMLPNPKGPQWTRVKIVPLIKFNAKDNFTEKEQKEITDEVFNHARMIPLWALDDEINDETVLKYHMRVCKTKLNPKDSESILIMLEQVIEQVPGRGAALGRLIYGKISDGKFNILWDSKLFVGLAHVYFDDVNGDGWQEIIAESATGGMYPYPIMAIFDKDGRENSRQQPQYCDTSDRFFTEEDGVCDISGTDISFTNPVKGPKDIRVYNWAPFGSDETSDKTTIFKLQNGVYVPQIEKQNPPKTNQDK